MVLFLLIMRVRLSMRLIIDRHIRLNNIRTVLRSRLLFRICLITSITMGRSLGVGINFRRGLSFSRSLSLRQSPSRCLSLILISRVSRCSRVIVRWMSRLSISISLIGRRILFVLLLLLFVIGSTRTHQSY